MTPLLTAAECRVLVRTSMSDDDLDAVIARIERLITKRIGAPQNDENSVTITETVEGEGEHIFVKTRFSEIVSITEDGASVDADDYRAWGDSGMVERLPEGYQWDDVCVVTYKPVDQRDERKEATINLVRLYLERTAMVSENVAGEYSFDAPDWDKAIKRELKNLCFTGG
ncbi:MAG: hypothetical protein CVU42_13850 [Chloroflexi bacterium HGW-Chloroflexi-4]|jgi:hypothetical protein|nr:MAG: hypothetical protein CVU42_13850 [Chloroflexi bacterium HGW-Chloroflexi-4]